jgi:ComF family protein
MTISTSSPANRRRLRRARSLLLDFLFPPRCAGCGRRGTWLCPACLADVPPLGAPLRPVETRALDWLGAAYVYTGAIRRAIHRFKYGRERARAEHLGALLSPLLRHLPPPAGTPHLIPVPLSDARLRERGYNQAAELARVVAATGGLPLDTGLLRTRATRPQVGLDRAARRENVRDAFAWGGAPLPSARLLLIDDVLTTGATADECAAVLKVAGAEWVGLLTVARATDHRSDR